MHEYSIIQSLVQSVAAAVPRDGYVHRIEVKIGELSGVDCELLWTAFEIFREGTICERATMTIDRVAARWDCSNCGLPLLRGAVLRCAMCGEPGYLAAGDEIILQRIEVEVSDVSGLRMR
jgi:hydrogenase nickel incorporation protein HypA/HybF